MSRLQSAVALCDGAMQTGWGNAELHQRACEPVKSRCRCRCGCKGRVTHAGMANGVALVSGCQLSVRRWVRAPADFSVKETRRGANHAEALGRADARDAEDDV